MAIKKNIDYPEIQASTLEEVVDFGLSSLQGKLKPPFVIDDSGVFIDHLKGFPGVCFLSMSGESLFVIR